MIQSQFLHLIDDPVLLKRYLGSIEEVEEQARLRKEEHTKMDNLTEQVDELLEGAITKEDDELEKAQERAERFANLDNIMQVYDHAIENGIEAIMLNGNDRAAHICDRFRADPAKYGHLRWYPSIPYPHKYAAMVNDKGMVGAVQELLFAQGAKSCHPDLFL